MNRRVLYSFCAFIIVLALLACIAITRMAYQKESRSPQYSSSDSQDSAKVIKSIMGNYADIIRCDNDVLLSVLNDTRTYLDKIPSHVIASLRNEGWAIYITSSLPAEHRCEKGGNAILVPSEKTIYLLADSISIGECLYHEIGHYLDINNNYVSNSQEFIAAFNSEKAKYEYYWNEADMHISVNSSYEFFAIVFEMICFSETSAKEYSPLASEIITNLIEK